MDTEETPVSPGAPSESADAPDFSDLSGSGHNRNIANAVNRAIDLSQIELVMAHVTRRLDSEMWVVERPWGKGTHLWKWEVEEAVVQKELIQRLDLEIERILARVVPQLEGAVSSLEKLEPAVRDLRATKAPKAVHRRVMAAVCIFMKERPDKRPDPRDPRKKVDDYWKQSKDQLFDPRAFIGRLREYERDHIDKKVMRKLSAFLVDPELDLNKLRQAVAGEADARLQRVGEVLVHLMTWVHSMHAYYFVAQELVPLREHHAAAKAALERVKMQVAMGSSVSKMVEVFGKVVHLVPGGVHVEFDRPDMPSEEIPWASLMDTTKVCINRPGASARVELNCLADVTFYDLNLHCVLPATAARKCSLVELMAKGKQKPDYFASHTWAQPVQSFAACLKQHAQDRLLESPSGHYNGTLCDEQESPHPLYLGGRSPRYWVSAFALRQHSDAEVGDCSKDAPFFGAISAAKGTVAVVDALGGMWNRSWCLLEIYHALRRQADARQYTFDMYTALKDEVEKKAVVGVVGITQGLAAVDRDATFKANRESVFPFHLLDLGLTFKFNESRSSSPFDELKVKRSLGVDCKQLDHFVHGVVAASALGRVIGNRGLERSRQYLQAVRQGKIVSLRFDLRGRNAVDCTQTWMNVLEVLSDESCRHLEMGSHELTVFPEMISTFKSLETLSLHGCSQMEKLPKNVGNLAELTQFKVHGPNRLAALPKSFYRLVSLTSLDLSHCDQLKHLPANIGHLKNLTRLHLKCCTSLEVLPDGVCSLFALLKISLDGCTKLMAIPEKIGDCRELVKVSLRQCSSLTYLPESIGLLKELQELALQECPNLRVYPKSLCRLGPSVVRT